MTASSGSSGRHAESRADYERRTWSVTRAIKRAISRGNARPTRKDARESFTIGNGLYLLGRIGGNGVSFLVDTGSGVSILAARKWRKWGRTEDELTRYWGRSCSVEGQALECLGKARLTVTLGTRVVEWGFIVSSLFTWEADRCDPGVFPLPLWHFGFACGSPCPSRAGCELTLSVNCFQRDTAVCWMTCFDPSTNWIRAVSRHGRRQGESSHCLRSVHGLGMVCGPAGPISLSAVFSSLVSPMGTMDVTGRRIRDMRSDGVHGSLKTTGMTTAPQFQLQRTSRGWVRRKK